MCTSHSYKFLSQIGRNYSSVRGLGTSKRIRCFLGEAIQSLCWKSIVLVPLPIVNDIELQRLTYKGKKSDARIELAQRNGF